MIDFKNQNILNRIVIITFIIAWSLVFILKFVLIVTFYIYGSDSYNFTCSESKNRSAVKLRVLIHNVARIVLL